MQPKEGQEMGERLKGKVAIVTGAGCVGQGWGNGNATAVLFAREGAKILAVDINLAAAEETKAIIDREGGESMACCADVSKSEDVRAFVARCIEAYGRIDILHNNVGIGILGGPVELSEEEWDRVNDVNAKSVFLTCKYVLPYMEKQGGGAIVNVSSLASICDNGTPYIAYSASKAAVNQMTQSIAMQYAKKNIRVNCILPGYMDTPMTYGLKDVYGDVEAMKRMRMSRVPLGRLGEGWDTAYAALFLVSDEAKFITGAQLVVDGGQSCCSP
jgi:NAD(P)-dependent dehydrogenase (short-subunit alcohol dehydrogenase family)